MPETASALVQYLMRDQVGGPDGRVAVPPGELVEGQGRERLNVVVGKLRQLSLDVIFAAWRLVKQMNLGQFIFFKNLLTNALEAQGFLKKGWTLEPLAASKSINLGQ